jgi:TonB-linked SusC/RagA family outer membrane protein
MNIILNFNKKTVRKMRITTFLLVFCGLNLFAEGIYSQNAKVNISAQDISLKEVLREIEKQTDYLFVYNPTEIDVNRKTTLQADNKAVKDVLATVFNQTDIAYLMEGNSILLMKRPDGIQQSDDKRITGTVTDATGEPIIGANISEKGTKNGTASDVDGKFSLQVNSGAVLVISYIGYSTQEITVGDKTDLNITLKEDNLALDEVVVVGYGTMQRKNFTGSVSTVQVANSPIALSPRTNAMDILRGTVTGTIISRETSAGSTPSIEVHGQKSVNSPNSNPLVVLDGVIYMGSWRDIDPTIIESMSVLKDATSLAAYGSQAANGVVMITTKKGVKGKPVINFDASLAIANKAMTPKVMRPDVYVKKVNLERGVQNDDPSSWMYPRNYARWKNDDPTDWWDYSTHTGTTQNYSLSVSGATENLNYYASISHIDQIGIVIDDNYKREAFTARLQNDITDWLQVGAQVNYSYNNYDGVRAGANGTQLSPYAEPYRPDGKLLEKILNDVGGSVNNPLWDATTGGHIDDLERFSTTFLKGHVLIKAPWIKGLSYRLNLSYSEENYKHDNFTHEGYYPSANDGEDRFSPEALAKLLPKANGSNQRSLTTYFVWDNILNYTAQFDKHFVDVTAVYTRDENKYDSKSLYGSDFSAIGNTLLGYDGLAFGSIQTIGMAKRRKADIGYVGRLNYNFDGRYHLTASVRRDGCTVFGPDNKWGVFPAVGLAWTASRESFLENNELINNLKVKASWGKNGNQSLNPYGTLSTIGLGQPGGHGYVFDNTEQTSWSQYISAIGNSELGWETTTSVNGGFDISLWKDRLRFELDMYKSQTTEQIFNRSIPPISNGFNSTKATMGQVNNFGIEFTLNTINVKQKDFEWSSMLNFYLNRNKLVDLYGDGKDDIASSLFLGKSLGAIYGYKLFGIVQEGDTEYIKANTSVAGNPKFANIDGSDDGKITADDRTILGYNKENFRMNMGQTFRYKDWELYALFTGVFGGNGYGMYANNEAYIGSAGMVENDEVWWTPENRSNIYPRINFTGGNYTALQSYGYVRLQDLSLSYTFRQQALKEKGLHNLRAYISVKNLFTLTNWVGGDPEVRQKLNTMLRRDFDPLQRTVSFGFNLSF